MGKDISWDGEGSMGISRDGESSGDRISRGELDSFCFSLRLFSNFGPAFDEDIFPGTGLEVGLFLFIGLSLEKNNGTLARQK